MHSASHTPTEDPERTATSDHPPEGPLANPQSPVDIRAKRPTAFMFLLRRETLRHGGRLLSLVAIDAFSVWAAIITALALKEAWFGTWEIGLQLHQARDFAPFAILVVLFNFARLGLYGRRTERPGLGKIVTGLFQATVVCMVFILITGQRSQFSSYYIFYGTFGVGVVYIALLRLAYESASGRLLRRAGQQRRAVLIGPAVHTDDVATALSDDVDTAIQVIGSLVVRPSDAASVHVPAMGLVADLPRLLGDEQIDELIITDPAFPQNLALEVVDQAHQRGVHVRIAPSTMEILVQRAEFLPGQAVPLFDLRPPVSEGLDFVVKRTFDLVVSLLILIVISPLMLAIALAIRLTSPGPVIYRSRRPGVGGIPFDCLKFRTMLQDAELQQGELEDLNEAGGAIFKIRDDPRVTPVGKILRRLSLDELPQLLNVLQGKMSLVGPRPLPQRDFEQLEEWHKKRYLVLPGITGLWQVSGRSDLDFDDMVRLDFLYLEHWSVSLDLSILVKTIPAVFGRRGAF